MAEIIFIYNADSGIVNGILDSAHKIISPKTYACSLCDLTHGVFGAKEEWKKFLKEVKVPVVIYHKNELPEYLNMQKVPVILWKENTHISTLISFKEMNEMGDVKELVINIKDRINSVIDSR